MALTASPLVAVVLGPHWLGAVPLVRLLALAMPFVALQILFSPVTNALGRPGLAVAGAACGAAIMPACFLVGAQWGIAGLAAAWIVGFPLLAFVTARFSARVIGITLADIADAVRPPAAASGAMAVVLALAEPYLRSQPPLPHLVALVALGAPAYLGAVLLICPRLLKLDMARAAIGRAPA
jgi:O-antigen/teichoic acid export membrane protein